MAGVGAPQVALGLVGPRIEAGRQDSSSVRHSAASRAGPAQSGS
jgi:hypothetical protein